MGLVRLQRPKVAVRYLYLLSQRQILFNVYLRVCVHWVPTVESPCTKHTEAEVHGWDPMAITISIWKHGVWSRSQTHSEKHAVGTRKVWECLKTIRNLKNDQNWLGPACNNTESQSYELQHIFHMIYNGKKGMLNLLVHKSFVIKNASNTPKAVIISINCDGNQKRAEIYGQKKKIKIILTEHLCYDILQIIFSSFCTWCLIDVIDNSHNYLDIM